MPRMIHDDDWPDFKKLMAAYRSGRLFQTGPNGRPLPGGRPIIRAILLADLEAGETAAAAVMKLQEVDEVQVVDLRGEVDGGTFQLIFDGETTAAEIPFDATATELKEALEELAAINSGDIIVNAYAGRWVVQFTGQYAGGDVALMTALNSLTGVYNTIRISSAFQWIDANRVEQIHGQLPMGSPTPLKAGAVVTAGWIPEAARYCIINVECRDLEYEITGS